MSIPKIDPYPPAPTPEDDEASFDEKAYEHAASLEPRRIQMNEVASYVNTRAADANNRATASASSATASANSATRSDEWANKAPGSVVASGKYSARHYSDLSDRFANAAEDVEVAPGKYSAQHYMEKAKKIADVHATTIATDPLPTVIATNVQEALRDLAYQSDQLRVAKNRLKYGDGPYPVLDFQFAGAKYLDPRIEFTRASKDWDWEGNEYGIDEPVLTDKGLWVSGARTNLMLKSKHFDTWSKVESVVTLEREGYRLSDLGDSHGSHALVSGLVSALQGSELTFSLVVGAPSSGFLELRGERASRWDVRPAVKYDFINMTATPQISGPGSTGSIKKIGINRYVVACTGKLKEDETAVQFGVFLANELGDTIYTSDPLSANYVDLFSAQVEVGKVSTPHIPTESSQVTVAAGSVLLGAETIDINSFSVISDADIRTPQIGINFHYIWGLSSGGSVASFFGLRVSPSQRISVGTSKGNSASTLVADTSAKVAVAVRDMQVTYVTNGSTPLSHNMTEPILGITRMQIGGLANASFYSATGYIRSINVYDQVLTTEQSKDLTS